VLLQYHLLVFIPAETASAATVTHQAASGGGPPKKGRTRAERTTAVARGRAWTEAETASRVCSLRPVPLRRNWRHRIADANMEAALMAAFWGIFWNKGEVCVAGARILVERPTRYWAIPPWTQIGPIASKAEYGKVLRYVEDGKKTAG
jgi:hypothetical protein